MTEFLGDGAFFLTTVIEEMVRENDAAVRDLNQTFAEMDASAQRFIGTMERHGGALQRVFAGPVTQQLERSAGAVDRYGQSLSELRASIEGAGSRLHELASAATAAEGALRQLPVASAAARDALVSHQREIRQEVNQTTDALTRQAQVAAAMFDPRRELGPTAVAAAGQSFMSRVLPDLGPGPQRALPPYSHGRIFGSRGDAAPGSIANPVVVTIERPEFAGLASRGWPPPGFGGTAGETLAAGQDVGPMVDLLRSIDSQLAQATPQGPSQTVVVYQPSPPAGIPSLTGGAGGGGTIPPVFGGGGGGAFPVGGGGGGILPALVAGWYLRQPALQSPPSYPALPRPTQPYFDPSMGRFRDPNTGQIAAGPDERNWRLVGEVIGQALVEVVTKAEYRYVPGTERFGALPPGYNVPPGERFLPPGYVWPERLGLPAPGTTVGGSRYGWGPVVSGRVPPNWESGSPPPGGPPGGPPGLPPDQGGPAGPSGDSGGGGFWTAANMMRLFRGDASKGFRLFGLWGPRVGGGLAGLGSLGSFAGLGLERLLFTGLSVAGSAGAGLAGAGVLAGGALAQMAVGQGSDIAVMKSTITDTKTLAKDLTTVTTNQQLYNDAVKTYGKHSAQAASALSNLHQSQLAFNQQVQAFGGPNAIGVKAEIQLAKNTNALNAFWDAQSQGARVQASNILEQVVRLGHDFVPKVVQAAQQNLSIINQDIKPLFSWLEGPQGMAIWDNLENNFKQNLPTAVHAFTQGIEALLRFLNLASNYTGGFITKIDSLLTRLNSKPDSTFNQWIQKLVSDFQLWAHFIHLIGADLYGLFRNDASLGNSLIATLNGLLTRIHDYEVSASGQSQLKSIFELHKQEVLSLLHIIESLGSAFAHVYLAVAPQAVSAMNTVVLPVLIAVADAIKAISSLSPLAADALGALLIGYKFGGWKTAKGMILGAGSALKWVGTQLGFVAAEAPVAAAGIAEVDTAAAAGGAAGAGGVMKYVVPAAGGAALSQGAAVGVGAEASLLTRLMPSLVAGGAGLFAGGILQHAVGLRGGTLSTFLGGGAGVGAAALIGAPLGPLGVFIAAGIGATLGPTLTHLLGSIFGSGENYGKKFGDAFAKGYDAVVPQTIVQSSGRAITQAADAYNQTLQNYQNTQRLRGYRGPRDPVGQIFNATNAAQVEAAAVRDGEMTAAGFIKGWNIAPYWSTGGVLMAIENMVKDVPPKTGAAGKAAAIQFALQWAQTLVREGKLPADAIRQLTNMLGVQFGKGLVDNLAATEHTVGQNVKGIERSFGVLQQMLVSGALSKNPKTSTELLSNINTAIAALQHDLATHDLPKAIAEQYRAAIAALKADAQTLYGAINTSLDEELGKLKSKLGKGAPTILEGFVHTVRKAISDLGRPGGLANPFTHLESDLHKFFRDAGRGLPQLVDDFNSNMREIAHNVKLNSAQGRKWFAEDIGKMVGALDHGMATGKINATHGMAAMMKALDEGVKHGAITWDHEWAVMMATASELLKKGRITPEEYYAFLDDLSKKTWSRILDHTEASLKSLDALDKKAVDAGTVTWENYWKTLADSQRKADSHMADEVGRFQAQQLADLVNLHKLGKINTVQYHADIAKIARSGWNQVRNDTLASLKQQESDLLKAHQAGHLSTAEYQAGLHRLQLAANVTQARDLSAFVRNLATTATTSGHVSWQGALAIVNELNQALKPLHATPIPVPKLDSAAQQYVNYHLQTPGAQSGAMFQIGTAGEAGQDIVPLSVNGFRITAAPGEVVTVFNRHQLPEVDAGLRMRGFTGLRGLFDERRRPHAAPMQSGGYVYPFGPGTTVGRTDEGVDASMPPGSPIGPIGDGRVYTVQPGWFRGQPLIAWTLTSGPLAGRQVYLAEQITNYPMPGQNVRANQAIASFAPSGTGIEMGWMSGSQTLAKATTGYTEGQVTPAGLAFRAFLAGLSHGVIIGGSGFPTIPHIKTPGIVGRGAFATIIRTGLVDAAHAANKHLEKVYANLAPAAGTFAGSPAAIPPGVGTVVGASEFGPPGKDPTVTSNNGAYGADVPGSIARLQSGGNWWNILQPMSQVRLTASTGKSIVATVTDAGSGGGSVGGYPRAVDLWWQTANMLGLPGDTAQWSGLLRVSSAGSLPGAHGLGHARGGMVDYAGRFGGGGAVTATRPTMAMFGDDGPETAIFVPHAQSGGMYEAGMAHAPYTAKPPGAIGQTSSGTWYKGSGSNRVYWEKNFKTGQYQWMTGGQLDHAQGRHGHSSPSSPSSSATPHKAPKDFETDPLRFGRDPYGHVRLPRAQLSALGFPFDAHQGDPLQLQGEALADLTKKGFGDVVHALVHFFDHEGPRALASDIRHITRHTRHLALHTEELKSDVFTVKHILHYDHLSHRRREHLQHVLHEDLQRLHIDNKEIRRGREMAAAAMNVELGKYAREFNQQSAAASNMSNLESALGGLTAGTPISDVGLRNPAVLRALGLLPKTGKVTDKMIDRAVRIAKSLRGTTPQAYEQQADYLQHTELPEYARDQRHLERLYRQALRDHNRTVAKKVLGELRTVTDARIQAETDLQTAQVNQINAIYQAAQTKAGNQQGATDLISAITSLSPGAVLAKMGITSKVLKSIGIDPAMANIGTSVSYFQNLESQQGGHLTADQVAAAHQAVRNQNLLLQGQMRTDERTLKNLEARLPGLTGSAKTAAQTAIEGLVNSIVQLEGTMQGNTQALKQLTTATNANTTATGQMTGQVAYSYNSQEYLASDNGFNVGQV